MPVRAIRLCLPSRWTVSLRLVSASKFPRQPTSFPTLIDLDALERAEDLESGIQGYTDWVDEEERPRANARPRWPASTGKAWPDEQVRAASVNSVSSVRNERVGAPSRVRVRFQCRPTLPGSRASSPRPHPGDVGHQRGTPPRSRRRPEP